MRLSGGRALLADRDQVWVALHDVECLQSCVPGCVAVHRKTPSRFEVEARVAFGPVTLPFAGLVEVIESDQPQLLVLRGRGESLAGHATGTARLMLQDAAVGCRLVYGIEVERSGPIAFVGSGLLGAVARGLVERFTTSFVERIATAARASRSPRSPARMP